MLSHILMMVMQLMLRQIQHKAMRNSIGFAPFSVVCSIYFFHDRARRGCLSFSSAATIQPLNCTLILDIHCWYPMYSLRLAPQWFTFTSYSSGASTKRVDRAFESLPYGFSSKFRSKDANWFQRSRARAIGRATKDVIYGKFPWVTHGKELRYLSHGLLMGKNYVILHLGLLMG